MVCAVKIEMLILFLPKKLRRLNLRYLSRVCSPSFGVIISDLNILNYVETEYEYSAREIKLVPIFYLYGLTAVFMAISCSSLTI